MPSNRRGFALTVVVLAAFLLVASALLVAVPPPPGAFHFVIMGDRTGEARRGIYEQIWAEAAGTEPAFVVTTGDTIQGLDDLDANAQWAEVQKIIAPYRRFSLYFAPGNHDIWSAASEALFRKYSGHAPHYSFDYESAH